MNGFDQDEDKLSDSVTTRAILLVVQAVRSYEYSCSSSEPEASNKEAGTNASGTGTSGKDKTPINNSLTSTTISLPVDSAEAHTVLYYVYSLCRRAA